MNFGFATRIALMLAIILGASVIITGVLSMHKYERTFTDFLTLRFEFVANDIRQRVETQMDLGLGLTSLHGISEDMEVYQRTDQEILSIEIFDRTGTVRFSTDPSFVGDLVTEEWLAASRGGDRDTWSEQEKNVGVVGVPLHNNLDQYVGSLALRYSRDSLNKSVLTQASRLLIIGASTVFGIVLISFFGAMVLLRGPRQDLQGMQVAIDDVANRRADSDALAQTCVEHADFAAFANTALAAHDAIDAGTKEIRRLDQEEAI